MHEHLFISELFYSIQGESTRAGLPCLFIRLSGCNLRCTYCDASYTWQEPGTLMPIADICSTVAKTPDVLVEITGGEPLAQSEVYPLMQALLDSGRRVLLETNGSLPLHGVPDAVTIIMDIKCPGSGMASAILPENLILLRERCARGCSDEIKFVLSSRDDFQWARAMVLRERLDLVAPVLFSPVQPGLEPATLAQLLLDHRLNVRLQLQLHTLLWPERSRGV
ncbi:radical SAM protein [Desulfobulbus alkaliphilus]|uniref:radical SAM protein n=1 Tax=Desulfobulbus alkaliphilus TaxID=869814 RepID=UPI0019631515|nr:radical SAM protein [Desulfobulbus alkaliphilus]MBM9535784.1 radical SAM protein [Desulfobulbus alkaliphilus]